MQHPPLDLLETYIGAPNQALPKVDAPLLQALLYALVCQSEHDVQHILEHHKKTLLKLPLQQTHLDWIKSLSQGNTRTPRPKSYEALADDLPPQNEMTNDGSEFTPFLSPLPSSSFNSLQAELEQDGDLLLILDRWSLPWRQIQRPNSSSTILLAPSSNILRQLASDLAFTDFLKTNGTKIIVGDIHPNHYPLQQDLSLKKLRVYSLPTLYPYIQKSDTLTELFLKSFFQTSPSQPARNSWYHFILSGLKATDHLRWGPSKAIEIDRIWSNRLWTDPFKGEKLPIPIEFKRPFLTAHEQAPPLEQLPLKGKEKRNVIHLTKQLVSEGHAPTKLLRSLCLYSNREQFQPSVLAIEALSRWPHSYPVSPLYSPSSRERGAETILKLEQSGVPCHIFDYENHSFHSGAKAIARSIEEQNCDILVAHGDDPLVHAVVAHCKVPIRAYVEHSSIPDTGIYDLMICNIEGSADRLSERYSKHGTRLADNPYGVDCRADWPEEPPNLSLPSNYKILTTISNHLESRLSPDFIRTIAAILTIVPDALYIPIGAESKPGAISALFEPFGVADRVIAAGATPTPSHLCRAMFLYLNEFPFGGGLSIMDGMSAGLPVVSMYDPSGPMQAQNAANYIQKEHCILHGPQAIEQYVEKAVTLLTDADAWLAASKHSLDRYDSKGPEQFTKRFENILAKVLAEK